MTSTNYNLQAMTEAMNREADMIDIQTEVNRYAELALEDAKTLLSIAEAGELTDAQVDEYGTDSEYSDWLDVLNVLALEVYGLKRVGRHQPDELQSVTVVTGTGGPHVEFTVDYNDNTVGVAHWGSDTAEKHDRIPGLFDLLASVVQK